MNPNTHRFCEIENTWTECSQCYTHEHTADFFKPSDYDGSESYDYYFEDYTCIYSISTVCDPEFVDYRGRDCEYYAGRTECQLGYRWYIRYGAEVGNLATDSDSVTDLQQNPQQNLIL